LNLLIWGLVVSTLSTPVPQDDEKDDDSELKDLLKTFRDREEEEVVASEEEVSSDEGTDDKVSEKLDEVEENEEDEVKEKKDDDENEEEFDALKAIGDAFAGFLSLLGGVVNNVDRAVNDPDVQEAVGGAIDAGVRTVGMGVELASAGASRVAEGVDVVSKVAADPEFQEAVGGVVNVSFTAARDGIMAVGEIAERAPKVIEDNVPFVEGVAKTIQETSGFVGGSIADLENAARLATVFAEAYTNDTLSQVDNFLKVFNRRLRCNTMCPRKEGLEKSECEVEFCEGFEPPKTRSQLEEEELQFINDYQYDYDYENEQTVN